MPNNKKPLYKVVAVGLMTALVYAGNYLSIPVAGDTRIHLGNSLCLLAGLLLGGVNGGLASGFGGMMYDLFNPKYITDSPITFLTKFAMGFTAGALYKKLSNRSKAAGAFISAVCGQVVYIVLYLLKSYVVAAFIEGKTHQAAMIIVGTKAAASSLNAVLAVAISVPLYFALKAALKNTKFLPKAQ